MDTTFQVTALKNQVHVAVEVCGGLCLVREICTGREDGHIVLSVSEDQSTRKLDSKIEMRCVLHAHAVQRTVSHDE
jgi:hypothetical protein